MRLLRLAAPALLLAAPTALSAQPWETRHQDAMWVGTVVDQPISARTALWFDGSWRRMDFGAKPQQLLLRPGVQYTITPGVRVAAGYAYIATAQYGLLPAPSPTSEHRSWQQLSLAHRAGRFAVSHRYRLEQRWIAPLLPSFTDPDELERGPTGYQNRLRYQGRGQTELHALTFRKRPLIGYLWNELLMPLGGPNQSFTIGQNRASAGVGIPLSATTRTEIGYLNLYNAFAARRANEVNHTLWVSWHYTGAPRK
jgi:hypothetical protein